MLNQWDIYWIMQLDSINNLFGWAMLFSCAAIFFILMLCFVFEGDLWKPNIKKALKWSAWVLVISAVITTFLPSTKTMAMMVVLPAMVNNERVQTEASEIYTLAKDALRELATPDVKPDAEQKE